LGNFFTFFAIIVKFIISYNVLNDGWFSIQRQVHWLLRHLGMRWVRWFPVAFLTDNFGWATCPRSLRSGSR